MKRTVIFMILLAQLCKTSCAQPLNTGCDSLLFEKVLAKDKVQRLWIYCNGSYILSHYEKNRIGIDTGRIEKKGRALHFITKSKSGIDAHMRTDVLYENKLGLAVKKFGFQNRESDIWFRVNDHTQHWRINPVSKDTLCNDEYYRNGKRMLYRRVTSAMKAKRENEVRLKMEAKNAELQRIEDEKIAIQGYKDEYIKLTNSVLPEYAPLMRNHYCGPGCFEVEQDAFVYHPGKDTVFGWDLYNSEAQRLAHFHVTIHETVHRSMFEAREKCNKQIKTKSDSVNGGNKKYVILNSKREFIECDYADLPKAEEMKAYIPHDFLIPKITGRIPFEVTEYKSPRLQMYVFGEVGSNVNALYGMLNEFSAYYHGVNASWLLYKRADSLFIKTQYEELKEVLYGSLAYYEFSLFMAWYIDYLKHEQPDTYKLVMRNLNLRKVFTDLEFAFNKLTREVEQEIAQIDIINLFNNERFKAISEGLKSELENSQALLNEFRILSKQSIASR